MLTNLHKIIRFFYQDAIGKKYISQDVTHQKVMKNLYHLD